MSSAGLLRYRGLSRMVVREQVLSHMKTVNNIMEVEPSLALSLLCRSGINPRVKSGRFMKILPDYEHMEYRDVYTCRMYLLLLWLWRGSTARAAWTGTSNSARRCFGPNSELTSLAFAVFSPFRSVLCGSALTRSTPAWGCCTYGPGFCGIFCF